MLGVNIISKKFLIVNEEYLIAIFSLLVFKGKI